MELSEDDLRIVARAARNERVWRYARFLELACWSGLAIGGFWLIQQPDFLQSELLRVISVFMCTIGGAGLGTLFGRWHNKERQLLLRLTSSGSQHAG